MPEDKQITNNEKPKLMMTPLERESLNEVIQENSHLAQLNLSLDLQKMEILRKLNNNSESYQRIMAKMQKRLNIPENAKVDVDVGTGEIKIVTPGG